MVRMARKNFMHFFLTPFVIKILCMEKLKQSNTFQYRYEQTITANNARAREVCCQAWDLIFGMRLAGGCVYNGKQEVVDTRI